MMRFLPIYYIERQTIHLKLIYCTDMDDLIFPRYHLQEAKDNGKC